MPPRNSAAATAPRTQPTAPNPPAAPVAVDGFEVVNTFPHDRGSFTQGLAFENGAILESQGQYRESSLRSVEVTSGRVTQRVPLEARYFAEGVTVLKGLVYQLTWKEQTGFIYAPDDLHLVGRFEYAGEGWGLTNDGTQLILSDGSDVLRFIDPRTFATTKTLPVRFQGRPQRSLNELEWVEGEIWANIWHSERIARIDPKTGEIAGWIDLTGLLPSSERPDPESVLNGIAYDPANARIFVTGKRWPKLFEIRRVERPPPR